jgi:pilus assembly protein CpaF
MGTKTKLFQPKHHASESLDRLTGWDVPASDRPFGGLTDAERDWKQRLYQRVVEILDLSLISSLDAESARNQIREVCKRVLQEDSPPLNVQSRQRIVRQVEDEILGLGPLEPLLADTSVSDILVNGPQSVYVERHGKLFPSGVRFDNNQHLMTIIDRIVTSVGRRIDESSPMVDARLQDGSRVNAIIPPLALDGATLSIRRFAVEGIDFDKMVEFGTLTRPIAEVLKAVIKGRINILISGGTGSGKTTMLNAMSGFIPPDERIITIEDSAELQLQQPHVVRLETRPPNIEGRGEVTQRDLVRNALRMRPDRIIVGEVRSAEALDMLQAMNTGHDGSLTTVHANSPRDALTRIESMVAMSGVNLPQKPLRAQVASAVHVVLQLERQEDGKRRLVSIQEISGMEGEIITMSEIFRFERYGVNDAGDVVGQYRPTGIIPNFQDRLTRRGMPLPLNTYDPDAYSENERHGR